jgi:hypothetical protein
MRTDCLSLLRAAESGTTSATDARRQLARIWVQIASHLDGVISVLTDEQKLVWMPAHQSLSMVGEIKLSNGQRLTTIDWRANRLVDALAKQEAAARILPRPSLDLLESANSAVKHAAMLLGRTTHAANNCAVVVVGPDGTSITRTRRDATPAPRYAKKKAEAQPAATVCLRPPKRAVVSVAKAWTSEDLPRKKSGCSAGAAHAARERQCQAARVEVRVQEIGASLVASSSLTSAADRLGELKRRVRRRLGLEEPVGLSCDGSEGASRLT